MRRLDQSVAKALSELVERNGASGALVGQQPLAIGSRGGSRSLSGLQMHD
jgi:hypothetical protein